VNVRTINPSFEGELISHFQKTLDITDDFVHFDVEFVDDIPVSKSGKIRFVVSEIYKD
jgi:acyl-coenzyme A synthetase/AMP-(fatty) acid ligase